MTTTPKTDAYTTLAFARWQEPGNDWSTQDFLDQLDAAERIAVFAGNFNQQVCNGGFEQWSDNGYATPETVGFLRRLCKRLNSEAASAVDDLLFQFERAEVQFAEATQDDPRYDAKEFAYDNFSAECDRLSDKFYNINEAFLADVEASL